MALPSLHPGADPLVTPNVGIDYFLRASNFIQGDEQRRQRRRHRNNYDAAADRESPTSIGRDSPAANHGRPRELPAIQAGGRGSPTQEPGSPSRMSFRPERTLPPSDALGSHVGQLRSNAGSPWPDQHSGSPPRMTLRPERQLPPADSMGIHMGHLRSNASSPWPDHHSGSPSRMMLRPERTLPPAADVLRSQAGQLHGDAPNPWPDRQNASSPWPDRQNALSPWPDRPSGQLPVVPEGPPGMQGMRLRSHVPAGGQALLRHLEEVAMQRPAPRDRMEPMFSDLPPHMRAMLPPMQAQSGMTSPDGMMALHSLQQQRHGLPAQENSLSRAPSLSSLQHPPQGLRQPAGLDARPQPQALPQTMPQSESQAPSHAAPQMSRQVPSDASSQMPPQPPEPPQPAMQGPADPWAPPWQGAAQASVNPWAAPWHPGAMPGDVLVNIETNIRATGIVDPRAAPWNPQGLPAALLQQPAAAQMQLDPWSAPWQPSRAVVAAEAVLVAPAADPWAAPWQPTRAADKVLSPLRDVEEHRGAVSLYPRSASQSPEGATNSQLRELSPMRSPVPGIGPPSQKDLLQVSQIDFGMGAAASHAQSESPQWQNSYALPNGKAMELERQMLLKGSSSAGSEPERSHPAPLPIQSFVPAAAVNDRAPGTPLRRKNRLQESSSMGSLPMLAPRGPR